MRLQGKSKLRNKKLWTLLLLGGLVLYPFKTMIVSSQNVLVVTEASSPIQGVLVRQSWQNYSVETRGHEEDKLTDENGRVSFPSRTVRANLLWRAFRPVANVVGQGIHAGFGIHTDMIVLGDGTIRADKKVEAQVGDVLFRLPHATKSGSHP
jgi:hypothetical protein